MTDLNLSEMAVRNQLHQELDQVDRAIVAARRRKIEDRWAQGRRTPIRYNTRLFTPKNKPLELVEIIYQ